MLYLQSMADVFHRPRGGPVGNHAICFATPIGTRLDTPWAALLCANRRPISELSQDLMHPNGNIHGVWWTRKMSVEECHNSFRERLFFHDDVVVMEHNPGSPAQGLQTKIRCRFSVSQCIPPLQPSRSNPGFPYPAGCTDGICTTRLSLSRRGVRK